MTTPVLGPLLLEIARGPMSCFLRKEAFLDYYKVSILSYD